MFTCNDYNEDYKNELIEIVKNSLTDLLNNEKKLFEIGVSERSKVFKLGIILTKYIEDSGFKGLNVDFEYNRNVENEFTESDAKVVIYDGKEAKTEPDLIIHEEGSNENNLLVIEVKCIENKDKKGWKNDEWKLKAFTDQSVKNQYKYKLGMHIVLDKSISKTYIKLYENGKACKDKIFLV